MCCVVITNLRDEDTLVLVILQHVLVSCVNNCKHVGRHFDLSLATEHADAAVIVDGKATVGIDGNTEQTRVGLEISEWGHILIC